MNNREAHYYLEELQRMMTQHRGIFSEEFVCANGMAIQALEAQEQRWIPITTRPMDEEERLEWSEKLGYDIEYEDAVIYTSQLPDDGQEVLTCNRYGNITIDTFENDPDYGCCFDENGDMDGIVAWMPLPEPYKGGDAE